MPVINRRHFLGAGAASFGLLGLAPAWARGAMGGTLARRGSEVLSGDHLTMTVADAQFVTGSRHGPAVTVNGTLPGPLLRLREGQDLTVDLVNNSSDGTSIHWHGVLVPFAMDGVPGITMPAVLPGATFRYRFPLRLRASPPSKRMRYHHSGNLRIEAVEGKPSLDPQTGKRSPEEFAVSAMTKPLFAAVAMLAIASNAPALAQDPHAHDVSAQAAPTAAPVECPAGAAGMASHPMPGMGSGGMQQNMGNMQQMQMMQQMQQTMQQMHTDMQQMHSEMMQMRQQMQHRRGSAKYTRQSG